MKRFKATPIEAPEDVTPVFFFAVNLECARYDAKNFLDDQYRWRVVEIERPTYLINPRLLKG